MKNKQTRLDYLYKQFKKDWEWAIKHKRLDEKHDIHFVTYVAELSLGGLYEARDGCLDVFNFFKYSDFTENKEYVSWFMLLYRNIIRVNFELPYAEMNNADELNRVNLLRETNQHERAVFFEDLSSKVAEMLLFFHQLKKHNILPLEQRDISNFKSIESFVTTINGYIVDESGADDSVGLYTPKEIAAILNYNGAKNKTDGLAEIVFENKEWVILITHDSIANSIFGKYTTWCTASKSSGYSTMFDSYISRDTLFVLIEKENLDKTTRVRTKANPKSRLQFHFESKQFMDANDRQINLNDFFVKNPDICSFFEKHVIEKTIPYMLENKKNISVYDYLLDVGFFTQALRIIKEQGIPKLEIANKPIDNEDLEIICTFDKLKELKLTGTNITKIPKQINNLTTLEKLILSNNKLLCDIEPNIISLSYLKILDFSGCQLNNMPQLANMSKLEQLILDNNESLKELPILNNSTDNIIRISASSCDLTHIGDDVLSCDNLFLLDVHTNYNLTKIPNTITTLPSLMSICIDETNISDDDLMALISNSHNHVTIIKYN